MADKPIPLGGDKDKQILAIMVGDKLRFGRDEHDVMGTVYIIQSIEGDSDNAQIYLQDEGYESPQRVMHYARVD